jgi:hypothetical protein
LQIQVARAHPFLRELKCNVDQVCGGALDAVAAVLPHLVSLELDTFKLDSELVGGSKVPRRSMLLNQSDNATNEGGRELRRRWPRFHMGQVHELVRRSRPALFIKVAHLLVEHFYHHPLITVNSEKP